MKVNKSKSTKSEKIDKKVKKILNKKTVNYRTNPYLKVDDNIYMTGRTFRVRVNGMSAYCNSKKAALEKRKELRNIARNK